MKKWKKMLCGILAISIITGSTVSASAGTSDRESANTAITVEDDSNTEDSAYLKNYTKISGISDSTIMGADFSHYQQDLEWNKLYYDYKGNKLDNVFTFVKSQGINTISVRVAVNPKGDFAYLSLENAIKTIKEAKAAGLNTNMILMYSDTITYQNAQTLPEGWTKSNAAEQARTYTATVLSKLEESKILPTMITIGNEVDYNFLNLSGNDGWEAMGQVSQLVKKKGIKVAIGVAAPTLADDIKWLVEKLDDTYSGITYDYVGVSIYPDSNTVSYMDSLRSAFVKTAKEKQLFVSSVKYPRVSSTDTSVGVKTQADSIYHLLSSTIDKNNAGGLIYEEAEFVGSWYSFFDEFGSAQNSLAIFAYAQGNQVDADYYKDPYQYGGDTGLKDQKVTIQKVAGMTDSAIRGMDIGSYIALKEAGVKYYNYKGEEESLLKILSDNGVNYIRIRIWNDPKNKDGQTYGGGNCDVETGLKIANEAKKYGMKILLCFHYSDFWADPVQQFIPKAWRDAENDPEKMRKYVYDFTKDTVQKFQDAGAEIGMVQVGNEITNGILGTLADRNKGETYNAIWGNKEKSTLVNSYLNAGAKAVREVAPEALIALHLETASVTKYRNIMNTWERDKVDYDVLGSSYYPFWATGSKANTPGRLKEIQELAASKGKLLCVLEVSWLNSLKDADGTANSVAESHDTSAYEIGPQGQVDCLTDMYKELLSHDNGLGAFYWEPAWIPVKAGWINWKENKEIADKYGTGWASAGVVGYMSDQKLYYNGEPAWGGSSWDNQALFDSNGYALQSLKFYKDSISGGEEQISVIHLVDTKGKEIASPLFAKVLKGSSRDVTLPKISGYTLGSLASTLKVTGQVEGVKHYEVKYTKVQEITSKKNAYTITCGSSLDLGKEITLSAEGTIKYSSNNSKVVSIDSKTGKMTAKTAGTAVITVTVDKTANSTAATKKINVTVSPKSLTIKSKKSSYKMTYGGSYDLAKDLTFSTKSTAKYSSSKSSVVSINSKTGKMTAKGVGTAVITVKVDKTSTVAAATKKITVTVSPKVTVKNKGVQKYTAGKSYKLSDYITISGKSTKKFTSSNSSIAKVSSNGTITAVKPGKATITVKVTASGVDGSTEKKITVYVLPKQQKIIKVSASSKALTVTLTRDKNASGYEIMVATNSKFTSGKKTVVVKKNSTIKTKITKLSPKRQYYVRVRSYKTISNKKYYGSWSTVKKMKTK